MNQLAKDLRALGLSRNEALMLAFLGTTESSTGKQIVKHTKLAQSEVSVTAKKLERRRWLGRRKVNDGCRGRPWYAYYLTLSLRKVIASLAKDRINEMKEIIKRAKQL